MCSLDLREKEVSRDLSQNIMGHSVLKIDGRSRNGQFFKKFGCEGNVGWSPESTIGSMVLFFFFPDEIDEF